MRQFAVVFAAIIAAAIVLLLAYSVIHFNFA